MRIKTNQKGKANRRKREEKQKQLQLIIIRIEPRKKGEKVAGKKSYGCWQRIPRALQQSLDRSAGEM